LRAGNNLEIRREGRTDQDVWRWSFCGFAYLEGNSVGENKIDYRASRDTNQIRGRYRQVEPSDKDTHENEIAGDRNQAISYVEPYQSRQRFLHSCRWPVSPRPSLMPDKIIQHCQLNRDRCGCEVVNGMRPMRKHEKCAGL